MFYANSADEFYEQFRSEQIICPGCNGEKVMLGMFPVYSSHYKGEKKPFLQMKCDTCNGLGTITPEQQVRIERGKLMRLERLSRQMGLRAEAERRGISPSLLSDMEQGKIEPK